MAVTWVGFSAVFMCLFVWFSTGYLKKTEAARHRHRDTHSTMSRENSFILGSEGRRSKSQDTKNIAGVGFSTLVNDGYFWLILLCWCVRFFVVYVVIDVVNDCAFLIAGISFIGFDALGTAWAKIGATLHCAFGTRSHTRRRLYWLTYRNSPGGPLPGSTLTRFLHSRK